MKFSEIKDLSVAELKKKRAMLSDELFQAKMKNSIGQLANPLEIRKLRRDIARINTAIVRRVVR
ncbi:MAG: 50S ribosomal protein L29 [Bdellovibrionaceae bacterium]|nr:50S ribosomal protein L29 [Pseudobdellovibrionaceae bacterium]